MVLAGTFETNPLQLCFTWTGRVVFTKNPYVPYLFYQIQTEEITGLHLLGPLTGPGGKKRDYITQGVLALPILSALLCSFVDYRPSLEKMSGVFAGSRSTSLWTHRSNFTPNYLAKA